MNSTLANLAPVCLFALAICLCSPDRSNAATRVKVTYDEVMVQREPDQRIIRAHRTKTYTFLGDSRFTFSDQEGTVSEHHLGQEMSSEDGRGRYRTVYHVVNGAFIVVNDYPGYITLSKLTTNGKTRCAWERKYLRKSNLDHFEVLGVKLSDMRAENITCAIEVERN